MKKNWLSNAALLLAVSLASGAALGAEEPDIAASEAAIREADIEFDRATTERDVERFRSFLAEHAVFSGAAPIVGRDAVVEAWSAFFEPEGPTLTWKPESAKVYPEGDLGYTSGPFVLTQPLEDGTTKTFVGHYHTVWQKQRDGSWKIAMDIGTRPVPGPDGASE